MAPRILSRLGLGHACHALLHTIALAPISCGHSAAEQSAQAAFHHHDRSRGLRFALAS